MIPTAIPSSLLTEAMKTCWTCPAETPYYQGLCNSCYKSIPPEVARMLILSYSQPDGLGGSIRQAIVAWIIESRRVKTTPQFYPTHLSIEDLDL